jgi:hypothetical protein
MDIKDRYKENYKTQKEEIKENYKIGKISHVNWLVEPMAMSSETIHMFNSIPIRISVTFFTKNSPQKI